MAIVPTLLAFATLFTSQAKPTLTLTQLNYNINKAYSQYPRSRETWKFKVGAIEAITLVRTKDGKKTKVTLTSIAANAEFGFDGVKGFQIDHDAERYMVLSQKEFQEELKVLSVAFDINPQKMASEGTMIKSVKEVRLDGKRARLVTLVNYNEGSAIRFWFPTNSWLPKQIQIEGADQSIAVLGKMELKKLTTVPAETFRLPAAVLGEYEQVLYEDFPDAAKRLPSGVSIAGELDKQLTKSGWARWGLGIVVEPTTAEEFELAARAIGDAIGQYPAGFVKKHLDRVWVAGSLGTSIMGMGGTYNERFMYLVPSTEEWVRKAFHHEFSSFLLHAHKAEFPGTLWNNLTQSGYKGLGVDQSNWDVGDDESYKRGFVEYYGETNFENDFNTYVEALLSGSMRLALAESKSPLVRQKADLVRGFYRSLIPEFTDDYFKGLVRSLAWKTDEQLPPPAFKVGDHFAQMPVLERKDESPFWIRIDANDDVPNQPYIILFGKAEDTEDLASEWVARGYAVVRRVAYSDDPEDAEEPQPGDEEIILSYVKEQRPENGDAFNSDLVVVAGLREGAVAAQKLAQAEGVHSLILIDPPADLAPITLAKPMLVVGGNAEGQTGFEDGRLPKTFWQSPVGGKFAYWALENYDPEEALKPLWTPASISFLDAMVRGDDKAKGYLTKNRLASGPLKAAFVQR